MNDLIKSNGFHPAVREAAADISAVYHERDELEIEAEDLRNRLTVAENMNLHYKTQLTEITKDRDHYMRYGFALSTRINAMQDIMNGIMDLAQHEANNPGRMTESELTRALEDKGYIEKQDEQI